MKRMSRAGFGAVLAIIAATGLAWAQKIDEVRMKRDIEVAENVLATLIKQKFDDKRIFFSQHINGQYLEGYGVTFALPPNYTTPIAFSIENFNDDFAVYNYSYNGAHRANDHRNYRNNDERSDDMEDDDDDDNDNDNDDNVAPQDKGDKYKYKLKEKRSVQVDSIRDVYVERVIEASREFLTDYGDIISQLSDAERIVITNQHDRSRVWAGNLINNANKNHLSVEITKAFLNQFKQGKLTRDQLLDKIKVVNEESVSEVEPDLELLSSIFSRLYRSDLSKTFFIDGPISYERLKDFGAMYYMQVYSSHRVYNNSYDMPTIELRGLSQEERDQKVKELYPVFEKELKQNILEYGRTVKSLNDNESLIFNITLTRCDECGIPSSLELSIKASVLKDYNAGKIEGVAAVSKMVVKKMIK